MFQRTTLQIDKQRPIRSFVERQGRISPVHRELVAELWPQFGIPLSQQKIDGSALFGRIAPVTLEIGFGNGHSLLSLARENPQQDFIGVEVYKAGIAKLLVGIHELALTNIRIFCADAIEVLINCIHDQSLDKAQLFFPDPWPKARHHKRRIVQPAFTQLIASKLNKEGVFHMATDWHDYALQMLAVMEAQDLWVNLAGTAKFIARPASRPETKFEQRGKRLGYGVWDLVFRKNHNI